ncbi:PREDICTED: uncharacterized protein LOC109213063 [Nicotiana attenuata]|uniref:uncharacterized protein LOC109213063 n=1 Tax=Nicotiana attenuata TaxID=49451 RepID=UPI000905BB8D|nr:PREDICTED: uncharacterized protein LOC109213063 [Nicotiana attenuata]
MVTVEFVIALVASRHCGANLAITPVEMNQKLTSVEFDNLLKNDYTDETLKDPSTYQRLVDRLLYLTMNRPDFFLAVQVLSQFMHCLKASHMKAAIRIVRYIKVEPRLGLFIHADGSNNLVAYCDSDWGIWLQTK